MQQLEKLIAMFGRGNLLEAIFIFLGGFQNMISHDKSDPYYIDHRNFFHLHEFISKNKTQPLDRYFKLMLSLQGLCLIYEKAYKILNHHNNLSTQEVIDEIYVLVAMNQELTKIVKMVDKEKDKPIKLLNMIANPKGEPPFNSVDDFEIKVLKDIRELVNKTEPTNHLNGIVNSKILRYSAEEEKKQFYKISIPLYKELIKLYCQINNVSINENLILALIIVIKEEAQYLPDGTSNKFLTRLDAIDDNSVCQLLALARFIQFIQISNENYTFNSDRIDEELNNIKVIYSDNDFVPMGISKDSLTYLINSDDQDLAKKIEDKVLVKSIELSKRKALLCTTASLSITFTALLLSSILDKFLCNKYNIAALVIFGTATLILGAFTLRYSKIQQQEPSSELNQIKVNDNENKALSYNEPLVKNSL